MIVIDFGYNLITTCIVFLGKNALYDVSVDVLIFISYLIKKFNAVKKIESSWGWRGGKQNNKNF